MGPPRRDFNSEQNQHPHLPAALSSVGEAGTESPLEVTYAEVEVAQGRAVRGTHSTPEVGGGDGSLPGGQ